MSGELVTLQKDGKIIRVEEEHKAVFHPETNSASLDIMETIKEKVLILTFNNGISIENIIIRNLADMRGNLTKEQLVYQKVAEGKGHLVVLSNGEKRIIRVSNIISVDTKWLTI